jgi:hypothetical protein
MECSISSYIVCSLDTAQFFPCHSSGIDDTCLIFHLSFLYPANPAKNKHIMCVRTGKAEASEYVLRNVSASYITNIFFGSLNNIYVHWDSYLHT